MKFHFLDDLGKVKSAIPHALADVLYILVVLAYILDVQYIEDMRACLPFPGLTGATYGDAWKSDPFLKPFGAGHLYRVFFVVFLNGGDPEIVEIHNHESDDDRHS